VEVVVMRPSSSKPVKLTMVADELKPASYNWQVLFICLHIGFRIEIQGGTKIESSLIGLSQVS
jgi:hypothetical protein